MPNKEEYKHFKVFLAAITDLEEILNKIHVDKFQVVQVQPTGRKINEINEMAIVTIAPPTDKMLLEAASKQYGIPMEKLRINKKTGQIEMIKDEKPKEEVKKGKANLKVVKDEKKDEKTK